MRGERFRVALASAVIFVLIVFMSFFYRFYRSAEAMENAVVFWIAAAVYFAIPVIWGVSVRRRILHARIRRDLYGITISMDLLVILRCLRYRIYSDVEPASQLLWFAYYIPMLLIPAFSYLAFLCVGRSEREPIPKRGIAVSVLSGLLILGIMTNGLHGLAFRLGRGAEDWTKSDEYTYGPLYFAVVALILALIASMFVHLWRRCQLKHRGRRIAVPLSVLAVFIALGVVYTADPIPPYSHSLEIVVLVNMGTISLWEACLQTDLFPMNEQYREMFAASPIAAKIVDRDYHVHYASDTAMNLPTSVLIHAENGAIPLGNGTRLRSAPIAGGRVLWLEDVSEVERMLGALRDTGERLAENNELLAAEVELRRRRASVDEENRLYDRIASEVSGSLGKLDGLLAAESVDPADDARRLAAVCVIGAYVKRRSNLILIGERENTVAAAELGLCLRESLESLGAAGIETSLDAQSDGNLTKETVWLAYDVFEEAAERSLDGAKAIRAEYRASEGALLLRVRCEGVRFFFPDDWRREEIGRLGGALAVTAEEDRTTVTFRFNRYGRLELCPASFAESGGEEAES